MALAVLQDRLRCAGITGRYLDPSNLHMTLAFIGETWQGWKFPQRVCLLMKYAFTVLSGEKTVWNTR